MSASCPGFRPHAARATRCRRCFRDYGDHNPEQLGQAKDDKAKSEPTAKNNNIDIDVSARALLSKKNEEQSAPDVASNTNATGAVRKRTRNTTENAEPVEPPKAPTSTERRRRPFSADMTDADTVRRRRKEAEDAEAAPQRVQIIEAKEVARKDLCFGNSDEATSPDVEFILRVKTTAANNRDFDNESLAATETTEMTEATLTGFQESIEELQSTVAGLKKDLETAETKCTRLEKEKKDIITKRRTTDRDKEALEKTASEIMKLRAKINDLESKQDDLKDENKVLKLEKKELQQELGKREDPLKIKDTVEGLRNKLQQAETLCEELMEENEEMKRDMKEMEEELDELHDNFREDQANEFFDLKKELETTAKNCRVLQFKLRKSERKNEQLEVEKSQLDEKNKDLHAIGKIEVDKTRMKELECELSVAKEVSLKMHSEIEGLKETLKRSESARENQRKQLAGEKMNGIPSVVELPTITKDTVMGKGYEALVRDLYDTMERETDLREQMRFSEDEIKTVRRKVSSLEQENETLVMQLKKLATTRSKKAGEEIDDDDLTPEELKLQFELTEQEMCVLRKKVDEIEHENEGLEQEVKYLQDKLINQPLASIELPEPGEFEVTGANIYMEQKIKLLEYEARELRRKLVEKERDNERLQTEVEVHRRKASKVIVRSRSLDSEFQVDLKRQLQLVEQEASILRQKTMDLENENDKYQSENKRYQLRLGRKPPPGPAELMQLENMELKDRTQDMERRLNILKDELQKAAAGGVIPATVIQEYKPRREAGSDTENQLITSLKKTIATKDEEAATMQGKVTQMEVDNSRLNREYKKLKDTLNHKRRPSRVLRETATRMEMREIVKELEDEISDLQITLRGREVVQEDLTENLDRLKKELDSAQKELKQREDKMNAELNNLRHQAETLKSETASERKRSAILEEQLKKLAGDQGMDIKVLDSLQSLQTERDDLMARCEKAEKEMKAQNAKVKELQDKVKANSNLKEELAQGRKILEEQKTEMERETNKHKELLKKAEAQVKNLRKTLEQKEKEETTFRKETNELKNELEEEKSKKKQHDNRQTEVAVGWLKEREELKKVLAELRTKTDVLQKEVEGQETQWKDKETRIREDQKKRQEKAVNEAKQQMDADIKLAQKEEKSAKAKVTEVTEQLDKAEIGLKESQDKMRMLTAQLRREREEWQTTQTGMETELRAETKKRERTEKEHEAQRRQVQEELLKSRDRVFQLEREHRKTMGKIDDMEGEHSEKVKQLEKEIEQERQEYDELTSKYEILEEEFLAVKSRLVSEKEQVQANLTIMRRNYEVASTELASVKDTFNVKQDSWIKDKTDMNEKMKELKAKVNRLGTYEHENSRLKDTIDEKGSLIESYRKEEKHLKEERERLRRKVEEQSKRVSDLERMERASRALANASRTDREAQDLKNKLDHNETTHRGEIASLRSDYETRIELMSHEMQLMHAQILETSRDKEELVVKIRETELAMDEFKTNSLRRDRVRTREEVEKVRRRAEELERLLSDTTEKLEGAQLESRNMKVQAETDKKSWQVQIAELKSKINQFEEVKLLESSRGSTRGYAKTRLELAWDKERSEQQRLLNETQALVGDLRDKVVTLETLKDKEKQDYRRQVQDLKALLDMEEQTTSRKVTEMQADSTGVKDSYDKLRNQYEMLRRDKERFEQEREEWRQRLINTENVHGKVSDLMEEVQKMATLVASEVPKTANGDITDKLALPKAPVRRGSRATEELRIALEKIKKRTEELQKVSAPLSDADLHKTSTFRRAISASEVNSPVRVRGSSHHGDPSQRWMNPQRITNYPLAPPSMILRPPPRQKTLYRKSLSLDQQLHSLDSGGKIWDSGDESLNTTPYGSQLSLRTRLQGAFLGYESDSSVGGMSLDSRASTLPRGNSFGLSVLSRPLQSSREGSLASSTEELPIRLSKPKKTLREKLKLTKKKKPEGQTPVVVVEGEVPVKEEKEQSIRSRISKALKKPLSRASSLDRSANAETAKTTVEDKTNTLQRDKSSSKRSLLDRFTGSGVRTRNSSSSTTVGSSQSPLPQEQQESSLARPLRPRPL